MVQTELKRVMLDVLKELQLIRGFSKMIADILLSASIGAPPSADWVRAFYVLTPGVAVGPDSETEQSKTS